MPLNWSAYEDIAEFFTNDVKTIDGKPIYGHMDYGKKDPSLGWRFTDAWLSMAGTADIGIPNGKPVDEWGIRASADGCTPLGASVSRGGATNSPAAVYALTKYVDWMKKYAPKEATGMTFGEAGPVPAQGQIAQQIFWYTAFTADMTKPGLPVVNADGTPKWRMAPGPNGPYWKQGMQNGYQDVGSWTFFEDHDANKTAAAWLYAQFITAKTTSLKKTIVGLTPIRESDIQSKAMTDMAPKLGGLVEFYRSPARVAWTPTGTNVPDYPKLAQLWWKNVAVAVTGEKTPQAAMDNLAEEMDQVMARLERAGMATLRAQAQPEGRPEQVAERQGRAVEEAGQREAEGRDHRLRHAAERVEGGQGALKPAATSRGPQRPHAVSVRVRPFYFATVAAACAAIQSSTMRSSTGSGTAPWSSTAMWKWRMSKRAPSLALRAVAQFDDLQLADHVGQGLARVSEVVAVDLGGDEVAIARRCARP